MYSPTGGQVNNIIFGFIILLALTALFILASSVIYFASWYECKSKWEPSGFEYSYGLVQGCLIKPNGTWVPANNYRIM